MRNSETVYRVTSMVLTAAVVLCTLATALNRRPSSDANAKSLGDDAASIVDRSLTGKNASIPLPPVAPVNPRQQARPDQSAISASENSAQGSTGNDKMSSAEIENAVLKGQALAAAGNGREAVRTLMQALGKHPENVRLRIAEVKLLISLNRGATAKAVCKAGLTDTISAADRAKLEILLQSL